MRIATKQIYLVILAILVSVCVTTGTVSGTSLSHDLDNFVDETNEDINKEVYKNIESSDFIADYERQQGLQIAKSHKILFDTDPIIADVVKIGNEKYYIIKQNSWFGFAHRLDIYKSNGNIVEDENVARRVFEAYGWRQNIDKLSELDRSELVTISYESRKMYERSSSIHYGVGAVVSAIDEVQKLEIGGVSVWKTATKLSPKLAYFEKNTRKFDEYALDGMNKSSRLNACLPSLINDLDKCDSGGEVDWGRFAYNANETGYAMYSFYREMRSPDVLIDDISKIIKTVNKNFDSIGCGFLGNALDSLNSKLEEEKIVKPHYEILHEYMEIVEDADNTESDAYAKWLTSIDGDGATRFIYSLIMLAIILIIISIYLLLKQSRDNADFPGMGGCTNAFSGSLAIAIPLIILSWYFGSSTQFTLFCLYAIAMMVLWMTVSGSFSRAVVDVGTTWAEFHILGIFVTFWFGMLSFGIIGEVGGGWGSTFLSSWILAYIVLLAAALFRVQLTGGLIEVFIFGTVFYGGAFILAMILYGIIEFIAQL